MNSGWERKRVAELAHHSLGKMLDKAKNRGEPQPYLRNLNVRWFDFDLSDVLEMRFLPSEVERYTVRKGDVVICEGGYPGRAAIWQDDKPIYFQKALHRVRFHEPAHARWFLYYLHAKDLDGTLRAHFNGAGIQHFTGEALARFELPVPPLDEQQRIVAVLDEAFAGIAAARANAERNLRNARALFEAGLHQAFSAYPTDGVLTPLSEALASQPRNGWSPPAEFQTGHGTPILTLSAVTGFHYDGSRVKLSSVQTKPDAHYWLRDGELLITRSNTPDLVGHVAIYNGSPAPAICCDLIMKMTVDPSKAHTRFVYYYLRSPIARAYFTSRAHGASSTMKKLSKQMVQDIRVPLPPLADQRRVVSILDALATETKRLEATYQRKLAALDELKRSLLHHAFTGQLTAGTPAAPAA